jgi:hypothetical protein
LEVVQVERLAPIQQATAMAAVVGLAVPAATMEVSPHLLQDKTVRVALMAAAAAALDTM